MNMSLKNPLKFPLFTMKSGFSGGFGGVLTVGMLLSMGARGVFDEFVSSLL